MQPDIMIISIRFEWIPKTILCNSESNFIEQSISMLLSLILTINNNDIMYKSSLQQNM